MTNGKIIRILQKQKEDVLADGKVDWDETERLLKFMAPLAQRFGEDFEQYIRLLEECRADGVITPEESDRLATSLELVCGQLARRQLMFWIVVAVGVVVAMAFALMFV